MTNNSEKIIDNYLEGISLIDPFVDKCVLMMTVPEDHVNDFKRILQNLLAPERVFDQDEAHFSLLLRRMARGSGVILGQDGPIQSLEKMGAYISLRESYIPKKLPNVGKVEEWIHSKDGAEINPFEAPLRECDARKELFVQLEFFSSVNKNNGNDEICDLKVREYKDAVRFLFESLTPTLGRNESYILSNISDGYRNRFIEAAAIQDEDLVYSSSSLTEDSIENIQMFFENNCLYPRNIFFHSLGGKPYSKKDMEILNKERLNYRKKHGL